MCQAMRVPFRMTFFFLLVYDIFTWATQIVCLPFSSEGAITIRPAGLFGEAIFRKS